MVKEAEDSKELKVKEKKERVVRTTKKGGRGEVGKRELTEEKELKECTDERCPHHGSISLRGRNFEGEIVSKRNSTVKVEWPRFRYFPKYERFAKFRSAVSAHLPPCLHYLEEGDSVRISECRPLSKTKHFVVVGRVK
ncbi:MAG: 30S ribosomal protein S17 [Nanoarchaeota archaeon]